MVVGGFDCFVYVLVFGVCGCGFRLVFGGWLVLVVVSCLFFVLVGFLFCGVLWGGEFLCLGLVWRCVLCFVGGVFIMSLLGFFFFFGFFV